MRADISAGLSAHSSRQRLPMVTMWRRQHCTPSASWRWVSMLPMVTQTGGSSVNDRKCARSSGGVKPAGDDAVARGPGWYPSSSGASRLVPPVASRNHAGV